MYHGYKLKYCDPCGQKKNICKEVQANYVACFYGVTMVRIFSNNTSINIIFSVGGCLDAVDYDCIKEAITQNEYKDLYHCMYFVDDWEADLDEEWNEFFSDSKVAIDDSTAIYQTKFGIIEDRFNKQ